ncbi:MAG: zinc ribbon domain-containing protein [Bacteroidales bacterium]|nr:zinc ribbon domain-containing protein [Bacteroidales bacterium]
MSIEQRKIRQYKCPSCGGGLELKNPRTRYVACPYCGTVTDVRSDAYHILAKYAKPSDFPPRGFLKLGREGIINGKAYKIIGRTRWRSQYMERWDEEGESGYEKGTWEYDEWLLISEDATYFYIIEDADGLHFSEAIIPPYPSLPKGRVINDFFDNRKRDAQEYGNSKILYFEGESTYLVKPGRMVGFSQYRTIGDTQNASGIYLGYSEDYIAEWRYNDQGKIQEVEFFKERDVRQGIIEEAFMTEEERLEKKQLEHARLLEKRKIRKINKRIFQIGGLFNLILGIILSVMYSGDEYSYIPEFKQELKYPLTATDQDFVFKDSSKVYVFKPDSIIKITEDDESVQIKIVPEIPEETDVLFHLKVYSRADDKLVFDASTYAYDYKKYKGDRVAYSDGVFDEAFSLDSISGQYYIVFEMELPKYYVQKPSSWGKPKALVEISVRKKAGYKGPLFVFFGIIMLIISLFIWIPKIKDN